MAKQRMVATSIWRRSRKFKKLDPLERYLFLYLITNEDVDLCGAYEQSMDDIAHFTGIDYRTLPQMLEDLEKVGLAKYLSGWVIIPNYAKLQNMSNPKVRAGMENSKSLLPNNIRLAMDRLSKAYALPTPDIDSDSDIDLEEREFPTRYKNLVKKYGQHVVDDYGQRVRDYMDATGKKYKDIWAAASSWMRRDEEAGKLTRPKTETVKGFKERQREVFGE